MWIVNRCDKNNYQLTILGPSDDRAINHVGLPVTEHLLLDLLINFGNQTSRRQYVKLFVAKTALYIKYAFFLFLTN